MAVLSDLRAAAYQRVGIDHGSIAHVGAHVDVHRRHANHALAHVAAIADAGASGYESHAVLHAHPFHRIRGLVEKRLAFRIDRHVHNLAHAKANQDPLLHPPVDPPPRALRRTRLRGANTALVQRVLKIGEQLKVFTAVARGILFEKPLDFSLQRAPSRAARPTPEPSRSAPDLRATAGTWGAGTRAPADPSKPSMP